MNIQFIGKVTEIKEICISCCMPCELQQLGALFVLKLTGLFPPPSPNRLVSAVSKF